MEFKDMKLGMVIQATVDAPYGWDSIRKGDTARIEALSTDDSALMASRTNDLSRTRLFIRPAHWRVYRSDTPTQEPTIHPDVAIALKFDGGKPKWSLLLSAKGMLAAVGGVVNVLTFGAKKYSEHSWREVKDNERRYMDALIRHLVEIQTHGLDSRDAESGELHIDHLNCNGLFLGELARK